MSNTKAAILAANGEFPTFNGTSVDDPKYPSLYTRALNWCAAAFTLDELRDFTIEYLEKDSYPVGDLRHVPSCYFATIGKIAYVRMNGNPVGERTIEFFDRTLRELNQLAANIVAQKKSEQKKQEKVRVPPFNKWNVVNQLEDLIDRGTFLGSNAGYEVLHGHKNRPSLFDFLQNHFTAARDEYQRATTDFIEYFNTVTDEEIGYRIKCYNRILDSLRNIPKSKRGIVRKNSRKSDSAKVAKVNYCASDSNLNLQSDDPKSILGSKMLTVYNRKKKRVAVFVAENGAGLSVRGTTIVGYDEEKSVAKTLRKPEAQLPEWARADRIRRVEVLLSSTNGKNFKPTGRLTNDTIILKAITE